MIDRVTVKPAQRSRIADSVEQALAVGRGVMILQIIADDLASKEDISRWAKRTGHDLIDLTVDGKDITFIIRKA